MASKKPKTQLNQALTQEILLNRMTNRIRQSLDLHEILSAAVAEVRSFLNTDRIKVYHFDENADGEVIAESVNTDRLPSLNGLRFPATDIPPQYREMYIKAGQRSIINNINQQEIMLNRIDPEKKPWGITLEDVQESPIEDILVRPVDPCHIEYLKAMGVQSTLVVPIIHQQNLWGLLISHHSQPKEFKKRNLKIVQMVADQVSIAIGQSMLLQQTRARANREKLINQISTLLHAPLNIQQILQVVLEKVVKSVEGSGGRLYLVSKDKNIDPELYIWGTQPSFAASSDENIKIIEDKSLWQKIRDKEEELNFEDNQIGFDDLILNPSDRLETLSLYNNIVSPLHIINDIYQEPALESMAFTFRHTPIRSLLIMSLRYARHFLGYLTIFRNEIDIDIIWAGKLDRDLRQERVRHSFEAWRELKQGQNHPWTSEEIELIQSLGTHLSMAVMQNRLYQWEREHRLLVEMRNQELNAARTAAEAASRLKSQFLSSTSHELRTPLASTLNYLKLLKEGFFDNEEEFKEYINTAHESAEKLVSILNDILDIAKIEAGRMSVNMELIKLPPLLENQRKLFIIESRRKSIDLIVDGEIDTVWADEMKLMQIITNLLSNAFKFTSQGQVKLQAKYKLNPSNPSEKNMAEISVTDTGIGVDTTKQDILFEPFVQADGSIKRRYGGTGLGLTICKRLIELMGGEIWLSSAGKGQGTTVTFTLPLHKPVNKINEKLVESEKE